MEGYMYACCAGFLIGFFLWISILNIENEDCQRENNVYKCERVYIPVEGE